MSNAPLTTSPLEITAFKTVGLGKAIVAIVVLSVVVFGFLVWLIYYKTTPDAAPRAAAPLAGVNAIFNSISAACIVLGYVAIRRRQYQRHTNFMLAALASSALFLVCYIVYHYFHGDTRFLTRGWVRPIYFFVLITHIVLSAVAVPLILSSFYLSLAGKLPLHRKVSKVTLPIWLYVSVTGVVVYFMLKFLNTPGVG
jgi:putative membrane protein